MAIRFSEDDPSLNPSHNDYENKFNDIKKAEEAGNTSTDNSDIKSAEETPSGEWKNNVTGATPKTSKSGGKLRFLKKKGPMSLIITLLVGGGIGITTFFSPGILIVHIKEMMVEKFNTQLTSMDIRTNKILITKLNSKATSGMCSRITIACKYSTMTQSQIAKFEAAGIKVEYDEKNIIGRAKPKSLIYKDTKISADKFSSFLSENTEFRSAVKSAYNPKYAGFTDSIWKSAASKLGISKAKIMIDGENDAKKLEDIQEKTKKTKNYDTDVGEKLDENSTKEDGSKYSAEEIAENNTKLETATDLIDNIDEISDKGKKTGALALSGAKKIGNVLSITGFVDMACSAYKSIQALGYAAKGIRTLQLASYAMIFLNVADQIKAGDADAEDVAYLGTILTTEVATINGEKTKIKSATDSFGYKYAAFGDKGKMSNSASQYLAGGGLTGELITVTAAINKATGGTPRKTCGFLANPLVTTGGIVLGVAAIFTGVGAGKVILQAAGQAAISIATSAIPAMLQDIVAGVLIDETTVGEEAGDAITSGASGIMSTVAAKGGNAPLTPEEAVAYSNLSENVAQQYADEDRLALNPLDISTKNTFLGSIVSAMMPYISKMGSINGTLESISSLASNTISNTIYNNVLADDAESEYTMCQDFDYRELGIATDPFCNVIYGIPVDSLDKDPVDVLDDMISKGAIDDMGQVVAGSDYEKFLENCINRDRPLGDTGESESTDPYVIGESCLFNEKTNGDYYLYNIDQRIQNGMDGSTQAATPTDTKDTTEEDEESSYINKSDQFITEISYKHKNTTNQYDENKSADILYVNRNILFSRNEYYIL